MNCDWTATNTTDPSNPTSGSGTCNVNASDKKFNNELITIVIDIPESCTGTGCWWTVEYNYVGLVKDTTTWTAYIDGNPIRIIE
ncbi:MAG: hypothetical protein BMS9Abin07_1156 [Acidimicrobiia bacterium]|nr:MAG: hypothetical protein BMS9Abin07_1156 [Acidimicrobiia bacterium]